MTGIKEITLDLDSKMAEEFKAKIAALEAEIVNRDTEIEGLRQAISKMPEFGKLDGDVCFKIPPTRMMSEQKEKVIIYIKHFLIL